MYLNKKPTPYIDVNQVLHHFFLKIQVILGSRFIGMYLYGSLACGDFNHDSSDIDIIVVCKGEIDNDHFSMLTNMHDEFDRSKSPWAQRVEIAYIGEDALLGTAPKTALYPQIENGGQLRRAALESDWTFQSYSLHEFGIVVAGPELRGILKPIESNNLQHAALNITKIWEEHAQNDSDWLRWLLIRCNQALVVLTLCRFLYTHHTGTIGSKQKAARWAQQSLDHKWIPLIEYSLNGQQDKINASNKEFDDSLAFLHYAYSVLSSK